MGCNMFRCLLGKEDGSTLNQYLAVLTATITLFTAGMHLGWSAPSVAKITSSEYPFHVTNEEASYIVIIGGVGHMFGGFFTSILQDIIGRKYSILTLGIPQIVAYALIYLSNYGVALLYVSRVLSGIGEGGNIALIPTYISEVAEPKVRGVLGLSVALIYFSGTLFINVVGSFLDIYNAALVCVTFPVMFEILFSNMPESPYYLLMKKDENGAREALKMLRRKGNVDNELLQLTSDVDRQMSESGTYKDLFTIRSNLRAFLLATGARFFQQFSGYSGIFMYAQELMAQGTDISPLVGSSTIYTTQLVVTLLTGFFVDRYGRKILSALSSGLCCLFLLACAIYFSIRDYTRIDISHLHWLPILFIILYVISFAMGMSAVINIFISEIYSTSIKAKALGIGSCVFAISQVSCTKIYQYTAETSGLPPPFFIFAGCCLIATFFYSLLLLETKGKSLEEIQQELKGKV